MTDIDVEYGKPIPRPDEDSQPFFDGTLRGELTLQHCRACGQWMWPVRYRCIECFSDELTWEAAAGTGTVYSYSIVHQLVHPGFARDLPYNVAMVDLDEGVRMITNIVNVAGDEVEIGQRVEVIFEPLSDDLALPRFRRVDDRGGAT
jgi:uncharacterized OB-fold protein